MDETVLTAGQLTEVGVANLTALGNVIQWQKLGYDFQFYSTDFECDLVGQKSSSYSCRSHTHPPHFSPMQPVLVLSEGKSILKVSG